MATPTLSKGAIARMLDQQTSMEGTEQPILQILTVRAVPKKDESQPDRFRVILSDGDYYIQAMLSSQTAQHVHDGQLQKNSIVRVNGYASNTVQERRIIIILSLQITSQTDVRVGDPQNIDKAGEKRETSNEASLESDASRVKSEHHAPAAAAAAAPQQASRTTMASVDTSGAPIYPIMGLSPYQNRWTIKARVTNKSEIKHWSNARGEGKLFSCTFLDTSGEIRATGFNDQVDRLYPLLKEGHVYFLSKARVNIAKKKFSPLAHEYEITFERDTQLVECADAIDVPEIQFNFRSIEALEGIEPKQTCDVIGIVQHCSEVSEIISKASQKPVTKRELILVDQSHMTVRVTLWGKTAESYGSTNGPPGCGPDDHPVIAFKNASVGDFGGRSLAMHGSSTMHVNPDIPEAHGLRGWYDAEGSRIATSDFKTFNTAGLGGTRTVEGQNSRDRKTIQQVKAENLGMSEKPDYFNLKGTVIFIKNDNLFYPACPSDNCNKKVTMETEKSWRCEKCDRSYDAPEYRYILSANVQDTTGSVWLSGFNDIGEQMIGVSANVLAGLKDQGDEGAMNDVLARANGKAWVFNVRAKQDTYQDVPRVRYTISRMAPVDFAKEGMDLAESIKKLL